MIEKDKIEKWQHSFTMHCRAENKSESTINSYWTSVEKFLFHFNTSNPERLTYEQVLEYTLRYNNSSTFKHKKYALKLFYSLCLKQPKKLEKFPVRKSESVIPQVLNPAEVFAILNNIKNLKHKAIIQIAYSCALRISEVQKIQIKHIDGQARILFVQQAKGKKDRPVPIPEDTLVLLREYFKAYLNKNYTPQTYLFAGQIKEVYSPASMRAVLKRAAIGAGITKKIKFHTMRHSRATHWKNAGLDIRDIADLLGHVSTKTTEVYLHTGIEDLQQKTIVADKYITREFKTAHKILPFTAINASPLQTQAPTNTPTARMRYAPRPAKQLTLPTTNNTHRTLNFKH